MQYTTAGFALWPTTHCFRAEGGAMWATWKAFSAATGLRDTRKIGKVEVFSVRGINAGRVLKVYTPTRDGMGYYARKVGR